MALALVALEAQQFDAADEFFNLALKVKREDAAGLFEAWGVGLILAEQYADAAAIFQRAIDEQVLPEGNYDISSLPGWNAGNGRQDGPGLGRGPGGDWRCRMHRRGCTREWPGCCITPSAMPTPSKPIAISSRASIRNTNPKSCARLLRDARLVLSNLCASRNDMAQAEELLEQVLDEYPENVGALNDLGYLWVEQNKNLDRAVRMIEQAVEGDPDNEAYRDSLGWAYFQMGRFAEAVEQLQKAVAAGGDEPRRRDPGSPGRRASIKRPAGRGGGRPGSGRWRRSSAKRTPTRRHKRGKNSTSRSARIPRLRNTLRGMACPSDRADSLDQLLCTGNPWQDILIGRISPTKNR